MFDASGLTLASNGSPPWSEEPRLTWTKELPLLKCSNGGMVARAVQDDAAAIAAPINTERPFASLEDACERLVPFHLLYGQEAEEADASESLESHTAQLVDARAPAWEAMCTRKASEHHANVQRLQQRAEPVLSGSASDDVCSLCHSLLCVRLARYECTSARHAEMKQLQREKQSLEQLRQQQKQHQHAVQNTYSGSLRPTPQQQQQQYVPSSCPPNLVQAQQPHQIQHPQPPAPAAQLQHPQQWWQQPLQPRSDGANSHSGYFSGYG